MIFWRDVMSTIWNVMCRDDMNFSVIHVICDDGSFHPNPNKENQIPLWVNYNRYVAQLKIKVTHLFHSLSKQLTQADSMLQCPFIISTIVFKDPDWKLGHIATTYSTLTQVTLSLMDGAWKTTWPVRNFPLSFPSYPQQVYDGNCGVPVGAGERS